MGCHNMRLIGKAKQVVYLAVNDGITVGLSLVSDELNYLLVSILLSSEGLF